MRYDLENRTREYGIKVVRFCKSVPPNIVNRPLITQLVSSSTSIGANYCEADNVESRA